jgi:FKBP-type peptidyl-prolyl cis-trans isomerase
MKKIILITVAILMLISIFGCKCETKPKKVKLNSFADSLSYALGYIYGEELYSVEYDFQTPLILQGIVNSADSSIEVLTEDDIMLIFEKFHLIMTQRLSAQNEAVAEINRSMGILFMEENLTKEGVKVHESGIQYKVLKAGKNTKKPKDSSTVSVHYTAKLIDGTIIRETSGSGVPYEFMVEDVFEGWSIGMSLMSVGDIYEFIIPDELAFGSTGSENIEPGSYLILEVELLSIK